MTEASADGGPSWQGHILLKLSGEVLGGDTGTGVSEAAIQHFVDGVKILADASIGVGLVIGGGNIFRGLEGQAKGVNRVNGDYMGMLATVINGLALQDGFVRAGMKAEVFTPFDLPAFSTRFRADKACAFLRSGGVAIFAGGTGNPFCTTDSAAALRAAETRAFLLAKGTKVDGVYDSDPVKNPAAQRFGSLDYQTVIERNLKVMDTSAITTCRDAEVPILVFSSKALDSFKALARGDWSIGTLVGEPPKLTRTD